MRWLLLAHPVFSGPVALLAANDAILKDRWPGWWTGKVSDLAGVVVVTVLAAVVTGKPVRGGAVAAVGFAALKIVPGVAETAAPLLGGVTRRDPTDLVALLVIPPTVRALGPWFDRTGLPRLAPPTGPIGSRRSGVLPRAVLAASGATVAVLAVSATSCLDTPTVTGLTVHDEVVWAEGHGLVAPGEQAGGGTSTRPEPSSTTGPDDGPDPEDPEPTDWARSSDGGWTWEPSDPPPSAGPAKRELDAATACADATGCFRIADGRRVQHRPRPGDEWTTSFAYTAEQQRRLDARHEPCGGRSTDIALTGVVIVPRPDGDHVLVAAGPQGILHRDPDGTWERQSVLESTPAPQHGPSQLRYLYATPTLVVAAAVVLLIVGLKQRQPHRAVLAFAIGLVGAFGIGMVMAVLEFGDIDYTVTAPVVAGLSLAVLALSLIAFRPRHPRPPTWSPTNLPPPPTPDTRRHPT